MIPNIEIRLDWKAYFQEFCRVHGGDPMVYSGRAWFRDGWSYSIKEYSGPEYPPPHDPLVLAQTIKEYWKRKGHELYRRINQLELQLNSLKMLQGSRSAPLKRIVSFYDEEQNKKITNTENVNLADLTRQLGLLKSSLDECLQYVTRREVKEELVDDDLVDNL